MRALVLIAMLAGAASAGSTTTLPHEDPTDADALTAKELRKYFEPYIPGIRDCYIAKGKSGDGSLRLELTIHRDGTVFKFGFRARGVAAKALAELDHCLRALSATWHFPPRRGFTTAIVPFFFLRTDAPGAEPKSARSTP